MDKIVLPSKLPRQGTPDIIDTGYVPNIKEVLFHKAGAVLNLAGVLSSVVLQDREDLFLKRGNVKRYIRGEISRRNHPVSGTTSMS